MIIKRSTIKIDSVYDNKQEAEIEIEKEAGLTESEKEEEKTDEKDE